MFKEPGGNVSDDILCFVSHSKLISIVDFLLIQFRWTANQARTKAEQTQDTSRMKNGEGGGGELMVERNKNMNSMNISLQLKRKS